MSSMIRIVQSVFHGIVQMRNFLYNHGLLRTIEVSVPVVSVGNLSFGGTGKTPMVIWIATELQNAGFRVVILSRGYKRRSIFARVVSNTKKVLASRRSAGDEPYLMAHKLKGVPVVVSRNRIKGAKKAIKRFKPDIILLDDGFQHRKLSRIVDIVLIDTPDIFGNTMITREPLKNLRRADVVVFTKYDSYENAPEILQKMINSFSCPVFHSRYTSVSIKNEIRSLPASTLDKKTVWLIAGIGKPEYFKHTVEQAGSYVSRAFFFRDHARYSRWGVRRILRKLNASSADYLISTEKDWHKIKRWIPSDIPCYYLDIDIDIHRSSRFLKLIYDAAYLKKSDAILE